MVEQQAFAAGGGSLVAPAQRMEDFVNNKASASLPDCSYLPGIHAADLRYVLPSFVYKSLQTGFKEFGKKMKMRVSEGDTVSVLKSMLYKKQEL